MARQGTRGVLVILLAVLVAAGAFAFFSYRRQQREWQRFDDAYTKVAGGLAGHVSESWTPGILSGSGEMSLSGTNISDERLKHLQGLSTLYKLDLSNTAITDAGLEHLKGLTQLREINLRNTRVTDAGVESLQSALPDCVVQK